MQKQMLTKKLKVGISSKPPKIFVDIYSDV